MKDEGISKSMNSPPLTTWSGLGPLNSLMTMVMSETMSIVGTKIQKVRIRMQVFLSKSAMLLERMIYRLSESEIL